MKWERIVRSLPNGYEVPLRELADAIARSRQTIDVEFLHKGLNDLGGTRMRGRGAGGRGPRRSGAAWEARQATSVPSRR